MYENLSWQDATPLSSLEAMNWGMGDGTGTGMDAGFLDWQAAGIDPSSFITSNRDIGGAERGQGRSLNEDGLLAYLNQNNLGLKTASSGKNYGYNAAFNLDTGKMQGTPTSYNTNDTLFQLGAAASLGLINPAALGSSLGLSGGLATGLGSGILGAAGSQLTGADPLTGFALGGLGSLAPNFAGYAGINNPFLAGSVNGAVKGAAGAAVQGQDIGGGAASGGIMGGLNSLSGLFRDNSMPDVGTMGGELFAADGQSYDPVSNAPAINYWGAPNDVTRTRLSSAGAGDVGRSATSSVGDTASSLFDSVSSLLFPSSEAGIGGSRLQFGDLAQGLAGMYGGYRQRRDAKEMLKSIGPRRDAYSQNLQRNLSRRDAASGRRSDYAGREVALQSALAELDSRNAPMISQLNQQSNMGLANILQSGLRLGGRAGFFPIGGQSNPMAYSLAQPGASLSPAMPADPNPYSLTNADPRLRRFGG